MAEDEALQAWAMRAYREGRTRSVVGQLMGPSENNIIQENRQFESNQGAGINVNLVTDIDDQLGVAGSSGTTLEGAEVAPSVHSDSVIIDALRQAIRINSKLDEQRFFASQREQLRDKLAYWAQRRLFDGPFFRKLSGLSVVDKDSATVGEAGTANTYNIFGGGKGAVGDLTESDKITFDDLEDAKTCAEAGVIGTTTMVSKIRPGMIDGGEHYVYIGHNYDKHNLQQQDEWDNVRLYAEVRGKANPFFTGELFIWNNTLLLFHDQIVLQNNAGGVQYSTGLFLGAQSALYCPAQPAPDWVEKTFDYGWQYGLATAMMFGFDKLTYNSQDFAVIAMKTAAKNPKA
jgi:N4-gp56 family major capsid protein